MKLLLIESTPGNANEINASLLADGHEVVCADNLFTGAKRNIAHLHGASATWSTLALAALIWAR